MKAGLLTCVVSLALICRVQALTNIYSTHFEKSEGYNIAYELAGQNGWVTDCASYGGNGLLTNGIGSATNQSAYVGLWPLNPPTNAFSLWQPLNYLPLTTRLTTVKFSAVMLVVDSTNGKRDDFYWSVFNTNGDRLFTLDFYNQDLGVYYVLDDTNGFVFTGAAFTNDVVYNLLITMDFARNRWGAMVNGTNLVSGLPMTTRGARLDLGDVDAVWVVADVINPGDNFMIFDDYLVTAEPDTPLRLSSLARSSNGQYLLHLSGPSNYRYAIDATTNLLQWAALKTNTITNGSFDFMDATAPSFSKRFYRARYVP